MGDNPILAELLAGTATITLAAAEVRRTSRVPLRFTGLTLGYVFILTFGTAVATMLAWAALAETLKGRHPLVIQSIVAFCGVFGAQGILRNFGVTAFGKDVLTFDVWVQTLLNAAAGSQIEAQAKAVRSEDMRLANELAKTAGLDNLVLELLGDGAAAQHEAIAVKNKADPQLRKAFVLVSANRDAASAFVEAQRQKALRPR